MDFTSIATTIIALKKEDLQLRAELIEKGVLSEGYTKAMEQLHNRNAASLNKIIDRIGYPTPDKVGQEASEAAWLIIQHAIGQPEFMKKCRELLEKAVSQNKADALHLAYLTDRIAVFEGKPQCYGTQFDWDETGTLVPNPYDALEKVNQRRKAIGLNSLETQTQLIQQRATVENQSAPKDYDQRKTEFNEWRKKTGWIS